MTGTTVLLGIAIGQADGRGVFAGTALVGFVLGVADVSSTYITDTLTSLTARVVRRLRSASWERAEDRFTSYLFIEKLLCLAFELG